MVKWLQQKIIGVLIVSILLVGSSFLIGLLVKDWPLVTINHSVTITDVGNIIFTVTLAILIPLYIKYFIDNGNKVNEMVLNEVSVYRNQLDQINQRFHSINNSNMLTNNNKTELNLLCEILDAKLEVLEKVLNKRCKTGAVKLIKKLKERHIEYWKVLTGTEINSESISSIHPIVVKNEIKGHQNITDVIIDINLFVTNY